MATFGIVAALVAPGLSAPVAVAADLVPTSLELQAPAIAGLNEPITLTATVTPDPSGGWITFFVDGWPGMTMQVPAGGVVTWTHEEGLSYHGQHVVAVQYGGSETHTGSYDDAFIDVPDDRIPVAVSMSSSPNPVLRGEPITFDVSVLPNPGGGDLLLMVDGSQGGVGPLGSDGRGQLEKPFSASGTYEISVCYAGNETHGRACSPPIDQVVYGITTTTSLTIEPATVYPDESVTFEVSVSPPPEAETTVWVSTWPYGTDVPVGVGSTGQAEVTLDPYILGYHFVVGTTYELRAYFPGTTQLEPSVSDPITFLRRQDEATLTATVDAADRHVGDLITVSASVSPLPIVESAAAGFRVQGPPETGFAENVAVELGLDGTGETTVDTDGWPAGEYWWEAGCCGDPHLAPTTQRGTFVLVDDDAPTGDVTVASGLSAVASAAVSADVPATDGVGSGVRVVALSNDGTTWTTMPYEAEVDWTLAGGDGVRTVHAKWQDQAGNWSTTRSDSVILDTKPPIGSIAIAGGAAYTKTTAVGLATAATDTGSAMTHVALSNDGTAWTTQAYAPTQAWTLPAASGTRRVYAKWRDAAGNWSAVASDTIVLDTIAPSATGPRRGFASGSAMTAGRIPVRLPWTASDGGSGVARYELAGQTDGGAWTTIATTLTAATATQPLAAQHTYRFRVRAVDRAGNVGAWAYGATFRVARYSENDRRISYRGTWSTVTASVYLNGAARKSTAAGARASLTFSGRSIAWIARKGPDRGKAEVYVNGTRVATVDLYASTYQEQRLAWVGTWSSSASRTVTIRVLGTGGRPRVDLDALFTAD